MRNRKMTNKDLHYVITTTGFKRLPTTPDQMKNNRLSASNLKQGKENLMMKVEPKMQYKYIPSSPSQCTYTTQSSPSHHPNRTRSSPSQVSNKSSSTQFSSRYLTSPQPYLNSFLDRKWDNNLHKMNSHLRTKSGPPRPIKDPFLHSSRLKPPNSGIILQERRAQSADVPYSFIKPIKKTINKSIKPPRYVHDSNHVMHEDLTAGQKQYIWGVARCYSVQQLKELTQYRMRCILEYEFMKRKITKGVPQEVKEKLQREYNHYSTQIDQAVRTKRNSSFSRNSSSRSSRSRQRSKSGSLTTSENKTDIPKVTVTGISVLKSSPGDGDTGDENMETVIIKDDPFGIDVLPGRRPKSANYQNLSTDLKSSPGDGDAGDGNMETVIIKDDPHGEVEVSLRRRRPKSAKYQRRDVSAAAERNKSLPETSLQNPLYLRMQDAAVEGKDASPESSLEDELVFAVDEKLTLFDKILDDTKKEQEDSADNTG